MRRLFILCAFLVAASAAAFNALAEPLIRPVTTVTPGLRTRHNTIAHELLNAEAAVSTVTPAMYALLDAMIDEGIRKIPRKARYTRDEAVAALKAIDAILLGMNVIYPAAKTPMGVVDQLSDGLRGRVMNEGEIAALLAEPHNAHRKDRIRKQAQRAFYVNDCDTLSFLYLAIAEAVGLPLRFVDLPGHNFVRFEQDGEQLDWETLDATLSAPGYYKEQWRITEPLIAERAYLVSLTHAELIGYHFTITSAAWAAKHQDRRALSDAEKAAVLFPRSPRVWNQWAWFLVTASEKKLRDGNAAVAHAKKALSISRTPNFLDTLACAYAETGDFAQAVAIEEEAAALAKTTDYPVEPLVPEFAQQIKRFQKNQACRDQPAASAPLNIDNLLRQKDDSARMTPPG